MEFSRLHDWSLDYSGAVALQRRLAERVVVENRISGRVETVAGVDVSYEKGGDLFFAAIVLLTYPDLRVIEEASARSRGLFPYIPGLLSFRELPVVLEAFAALRRRPDLVMADGQGIAHPRRLGLASHLGLWLDLPTVGCAKSRLCGEHGVPGLSRGDSVPLILEGEAVGAVLTTRDRVKPLYVSPGHLVDVPSAVELVLACGKGYRMPEPTRLAHLLSNKLRIENKAGS